ncbi:MAG: hypothetical protein IPF99_04365 [Deltaproteobacteria bacterium]|nr:hypothetical protein [Deltaproteobacteria bacterium]
MVARCGQAAPYARACRAAAPPLPLHGTIPYRNVRAPAHRARHPLHVLYQGARDSPPCCEQIAQVGGAFVDRGDPSGQHLANVRARCASSRCPTAGSTPPLPRRTATPSAAPPQPTPSGRSPSPARGRLLRRAYARVATVAIAALALSGTSTVSDADVRRYLATPTPLETQLLPALRLHPRLVARRPRLVRGHRAPATPRS